MANYPKKINDPTEAALSAIQEALNVHDEDEPPASPAAISSQEQVSRQRPIAVEVTIETEDWGKIVRIIEVPG